MVLILNRTLTVGPAEERKKYKVTVECDLHFNNLEICQMRACGGDIPVFQLRCSLWGLDPLFDDHLFDFIEVKNYPEGSPVPDVHAIFETTASGSALNEDWGTDEVFGRLRLKNLLMFTGYLERDTNTVERHF